MNTNARRLRQDPGMIRQIERLSRGRARVWVTSDLGDLALAVRTIAEEGPELVVLCGGDGTFMAGVTALERAYGPRELPALAFAPAGTVATVARNWGERSDVTAIAQRVLTDRLPPVVVRPTLRVSEHDRESRIGFTVGTGLVAKFFERYYSSGARGYRTALAIVARIFVGSLAGDRYSRSILDPLPCSLTVDGTLLEPQAYSLIVCSVLKNLGLHMLVTYRGGDDPARPHLVASALDTRRLGPQAPRVLLGRPLVGPGSFDGLVEAFTIRFRPGESGPYVLDGDMFRAHAVTVSAGPTVRVLLLN
jgi:diacylglycerol kinase family enzyme